MPGAPYAGWTKSVLVRLTDSQPYILQRQYVVRTDGSIITRDDKCDPQRTLTSFETQGWRPYQAKCPPSGLAQALATVKTDLEPKGYERMF